MTKEIKKYYHYLDLPYSATEEDVKINEKSMIKVLRAKAIKYGKNYKEEIDKVVLYTNIVLDHIKKNGVETERHAFEGKTDRVIVLLFAFVLLSILLISSLVALL